MNDPQNEKEKAASSVEKEVEAPKHQLEKDDLKEEETSGFPKDVDFKKFLGCGG